MQHKPPAETRKPTRRPPKPRDARAGMPEFDRELIRAGQSETVVVLELFGEEDALQVFIKYVDRYFIKVENIQADPRGLPFWLNKNAILSAKPLTRNSRGNQE